MNRACGRVGKDDAVRRAGRRSRRSATSSRSPFCRVACAMMVVMSPTTLMSVLTGGPPACSPAASKGRCRRRGCRRPPRTVGPRRRSAACPAARGRRRCARRLDDRDRMLGIERHAGAPGRRPARRRDVAVRRLVGSFPGTKAGMPLTVSTNSSSSVWRRGRCRLPASASQSCSPCAGAASSSSQPGRSCSASAGTSSRRCSCGRT